MNDVIQAIQNAKTFLTISHVHPDGDAMASQLAVGLGLEQLGKKVTYFNDTGVPEILKFLPKANDVRTELTSKDQFDVVISCDCGSLVRLGDKFSKFKNYKTLINLDHHATNDRYGTINYVLPEAASSGEVVWKVLSALGCQLTREIATNIYCTLVTDTGSFRYSNTSAHTLDLASQMVKTGVDPSEVSQNLFESQPFEAIRLLGRVLDRLQLSKDRRYSWSQIFQKDLQETHTTFEMTEEFINYPRSVIGVEVAALFKELKDGKIKVSLRSKTDRVDVSKICMKFKGGGHKRAAACILDAPFEDAKEKILAEVENALK